VWLTGAKLLEGTPEVEHLLQALQVDCRGDTHAAHAAVAAAIAVAEVVHAKMLGNLVHQSSLYRSKRGRKQHLVASWWRKERKKEKKKEVDYRFFCSLIPVLSSFSSAFFSFVSYSSEFWRKLTSWLYTCWLKSPQSGSGSGSATVSRTTAGLACTAGDVLGDSLRGGRFQMRTNLG
jgi:hypothetical protein